MTLNLNRNQPRKCIDLNIIAWVKFMERHYNVNVSKKLTKNDCKINKYTSRPAKWIIGFQMNAYWDVLDVLEHETRFHDVPFEYVKKSIVPLNMPQQLSDRDINILYNAADVGITTSNGEGYSLCPFEHMALGKPQIASHVGGIKEFLNDTNGTPLKPIVRTYLDSKQNGIAGVAELINPDDCAEAMWKYFSSPDLAEKHGKKARRDILTHYRWESIVEFFYRDVLPKL